MFKVRTTHTVRRRLGRGGAAESGAVSERLRAEALRRYPPSEALAGKWLSNEIHTNELRQRHRALGARCRRRRGPHLGTTHPAEGPDAPSPARTDARIPPRGNTPPSPEASRINTRNSRSEQNRRSGPTSGHKSRSRAIRPTVSRQSADRTDPRAQRPVAGVCISRCRSAG
jgi:hypothetical protein